MRSWLPLSGHPPSKDVTLQWSVTSPTHNTSLTYDTTASFDVWRSPHERLRPSLTTARRWPLTVDDQTGPVIFSTSYELHAAIRTVNLYRHWLVLDYFCSDNFSFNIEYIKTEVYLVLSTMILASLVCSHMTGNRNPSTEYAVAVSSFAFLFAFYDD